MSLLHVADRAGTSVATVSRVLSGSAHRVAPGTRARVMKAAEELGYRPNAIARALAKKMTPTIGVIVGDITDLYFAEISRGVEDTAISHGYLTVICNAGRNPAVEIAYYNVLQEHYVAGILFAGGAYPEAPETMRLEELLVAAAVRGSKVIVLADRGIESVPMITVDNRAVLYDMTRHLIRLGHTRIAFVQGPESLSTSRRRLEGFRQAMAEAGLDASFVLPGGFGIESGRLAATLMLARSLPDAVVAATDDTAIGLMMTLRQAGVDVPRDISVAGVDDSPYSQLMDLTTVQLPTYELGALAARHVLELSDSPMPMRTILSHRVVVRGSTIWARRFRQGGEARDRTG